MGDHSSTATSSTRPPLIRGNTAPPFLRSSSSSDSSHDQQRSQQDSERSAFASHVERYKGGGSRPGENSARRDQAPHFQGNAAVSHRPAHLWGMPGHPPTPPLSTSPGSAESYPEEAYFPLQQSRTSSTHGLSQQRTKPSPLLVQGQINGSTSPAVTSPTVSETSSSLQYIRSSRNPAPQQTVPMRPGSTPTEYTLTAMIGPGFDSSCITIAARKGNVLNIVADRWDMERDCHHEWQAQFDRDADMSSIHANYKDGVLTVTVKRISYTSASQPPQMRS